MPTDIDSLLEESRCLDCLTPGQMAYIEANLLDAWSINESGFAPTAIPEQVIQSGRWFDAGTFTGLADGAIIPVSNPWVDLSPNHSNATSTLAKEPTYRTNIFGSRPAVRFFGVNGMTFDSGLLTLEDFTILAVVKARSDSIWMSRLTLNRQVRAYRQNDNKLSVALPTEIVSNLLSTPAASAKLVGYRRVASTGVVDFFENGSPVSAVGTSTETFHLEQIGVTNGGPIDIDIGEMVIYTSIVSNEGIQAMYDDYFKNKFGLP